MFTDPVVLNPVKEPKLYKTIRVAEGARQEVRFILTDSEGRVLDLSGMDPVKASVCQDTGDGIDAANPGFPDGLHPKGPWPDVSIRMVVSPGYSQPPLYIITGDILDFAAGDVLFHLIPEQLQQAGIYDAAIGLFRGEVLQQQWPLYLSIEQSLFSATQSSSKRGVISIPEIRLSLRDLDPSFNDVMEELEFKDAEIMACIRRPVDMWNEFLPFEPQLQFRYDNFPFRGNWLRAATGYLLEIAAHWYRRNDIPISAGGVQIQDRNKHLTYEPKAQELISDFQTWGKQYKAALSARMAFGSIGSTWPQSTIY